MDNIRLEYFKRYKEEERYKRFLGEDIIFTKYSFQDFCQNPLEYIKNI